ncbi:hypothetical protein GOBAR_AA00233 [Gossypium barbadense]|uniref:Cytochrome c oxidase assembly factor 3 mitochondrial coiled-coil domain-containing protein n=1 Tax=Gossypium barbadense TaxID=3634 RepID=A0A2P5YXN2_GOSBA|nr:hypothetical protein GOBAR_AA00233 [Gossypium barbadense]
MAGLFAYGSLAPKTKNMVVAGGLTAFVFGVYFYTMRAVGGTDELQVAIDKFEELKKQEGNQELVVDTFVDLSISGLILPKHDHRQIPQKPLQTHYPSPSCVVAKGALHGDLEKIMQAFRLGGLIDGSNYWFGNYKEFGGSHCLGLLVWCWEQMKSLCRGLEMPFQGIPSSIFHGMLEKFCHSFRARTATLRPNGPISRRLLADNATFLMADVDRKRGLGLLIPEHSPVQVEGKAWKFRVSELPKAVASLSTASIFVFRKHNEL